MSGARQPRIYGMGSTFVHSSRLDDTYPKLRLTDVFHPPAKEHENPSFRVEATIKGLETPSFLKEFLERKKL